MNNELILIFIQKFYNTRLKPKYSVDLKFENLKQMGKNFVVDVVFPDNSNLSMEEISKLWDDLYEIKNFISALGDDIKSINYNPVFNYTDEDES